MALRLSALVFGALALAACDFSFSEGGGPVECDGSASVTVTVDGSTSAGDCVSSNVDRGRLSFGSSLTLDDSDDWLVSIAIAGTAPGTYTPDDDTFARLSYYPDEDAAEQVTLDVYAETGRFVITSSDGGRAQGTFTFSGREERGSLVTFETTYGPERTVSGTFDVPLAGD